MAKKEKESYLSPKKVLPEEEYKQYKERQIESKRLGYIKKSRELGKEIEYKQRDERHRASVSGKIGNVLAGGITALKTRGGIARATYRHSLPPRTMVSKSRISVQGYKSTRRGRPKGSYDKRYYSVGGVYNWRKLQAHQRQLQKLEAMKRATISPAQAQIIRNIEAREAYNRQSPEHKIIPDSSGEIPILGNLMQEIDNATKLVP